MKTTTTIFWMKDYLINWSVLLIFFIILFPSQLLAQATSLCLGEQDTLVGVNNSFLSDHPAVVAVDSNGIITALTVGSAQISYTDTLNGNQTGLVCTFDPFNFPEITGDSLICVGFYKQMDHPVCSGKWLVSDSSVARINAWGEITGLAPGTVTIAYVVSSKSCIATAFKTVQVVQPDPTTISLQSGKGTDHQILIFDHYSTSKDTLFFETIDPIIYHIKGDSADVLLCTGFASLPSGLTVVKTDTTVTISGTPYVLVFPNDTLTFNFTICVRPDSLDCGTGTGDSLCLTGSITLLPPDLDHLTLAVKLIRFEMQEYSGKLRFEWEVASEENNDYFEIASSTDGIAYHKLDRIPSRGNTHQTQHYVSETTLETQAVYYRLSQTDLDGKTVILDIIVHQNEAIKSVYPNPLRTSGLHIPLRDSEISVNTQIGIADQMGRMVLCLPVNVNDMIQQIDLSSLSSGIYVVKILPESGVGRTQYVVVAH